MKPVLPTVPAIRKRGSVSSWLLVLFILVSHVTQGQPPVIDATKLNADAGIRLTGPWHLYWDQLLTPADSLPPTFEEVNAGRWNRDDRHPALGVGTYMTTVILPQGHKGLSILFPAINSAGKIWINGQLGAERGIVSRDPEGYRPDLSGALVAVPDGVDKIQLILQVANYSGTEGGFIVPELRQTTSILADISESNGIENFFAGSLVAMFFYQLILYFLYQRGKPHLWLALICLGVALRAMITHGGSFLLPELFPSVSWDFWKKVEFGGVYLIVALFPLYIYHLFEKHAPKWPIWVFLGITGLLMVFVVSTNLNIYGLLLDVSHAGLVLGFIYAVYSIAAAWRHGNNDARTILLGVLAAFPFIMMEILKNSPLLHLNFIHFTYLVEIGVLVFLVFQVYLLAEHYARSYRSLEVINQDLEKVVTTRTSELTRANAVKDKLLSVMSHDIKSPLLALKGIVKLFNQGAVNKDEFHKISSRLERDLNATSILVENILYWTSSQMKGIKLHLEYFDLKQLVEKNIHLFQSLEQEKKLVITHNLATEQEIKTDPNILDLVIRNLLSNAIKFTGEGGKIEIMAEIQPRKLTVHVKDNGVGMSSETLQSVFTATRSSSSSGTAMETGTGLGLSLCRDYLQKAGGALMAESIEGKGSMFTFEVPIET
ncbi:MAG: hypothetical protein JST46_14070 [Bacteroidetes bacterium]|nr:hypothetical protein [Bacteroidota bacterium]